MIKPQIWTDAHFVQLSPLARLLFIGMWNFADDNGVIKDVPIELKMQVFPADNIDVAPLIEEIVKLGMIIRFEVNGVSWLWIKGLTKHQYIQKKTQTTNPLPPQYDASIIPASYQYDTLITEPNRTEPNRKEKNNNNACARDKKINENENVVVVPFSQKGGNGRRQKTAPASTIDKLVEAGLTPEKASQLISQSSHEEIEKYIEYYKNQPTVQGVGWLVKAIENSWSLPKNPLQEAKDRVDWQVEGQKKWLRQAKKDRVDLDEKGFVPPTYAEVLAASAAAQE